MDLPSGSIRRPAAAALAVVALAGAAAAFFPSTDPDVYFHLSAGRDIAAAGTVPATETLCYPVEGRPFVNHEWAFDAALWAATGGDGTALAAFRSVLAAALFAAAGLVALRLGATPLATAATGVAFLAVFRESLDARPHLAGYLLAALFWLALEAAGRGGRRRVLWLPALAAAWANVHGSFPLVFALWGLRLAASWRGPPEARGRLLVAGPAIALATLATPWGPGVWGVVLHHLEPAYRDLVPEWQPVAWGEVPARDLPYLALVAGGLLSFLPRANRRRLADLALFLGFVAPAALSVKFVLGLAAFAAPVLAANLSRLGPWGRPARAAGAAAAIASAGLCAAAPPHAAPGPGFDLDAFPAGPIAFARERGLSGRAFHPFDVGGYVGFAGAPGIRPYIDGRAYVHGMDGIRTYLGALADYGRFRALDARWRFDLVLVDLLDPSFPRVAEGLSGDPAWDLVRLDSRWALFTRAGAGGLPPYRALRATTDPRYLFALPAEALPAAHAEAARVADTAGGETMARLVRGTLALREAGAGPELADADRPGVSAARCRDAAADFRALADARPDVPMFRHFLAIAERCGGR